MRIDALFDVAMAGKLPAIILIDEVDTILSTRASARVGKFADKFERFKENLLVIGATNDPDKIAPRIMARFERKILVDNPNSSARRALIARQLAEEDEEHEIDGGSMHTIIEQTAGRSVVNMEP